MATARTRRRSGADDGFSLVELLVSMVVIGILIAGMAGVQARALATVTVSRQRQQAIDLANKAMEQMRALPYDTVIAGIRTPDIAGDPWIIAGKFRPPYDSSVNEFLVTSGSVPAAPLYPLYPHRQTGATSKIGPIQFTISSYVTLVSATAGDTSKGYWLTVVASWTSAQARGVTKRISIRSQLFSPSGCLSTATHPFSGPCQAFFDGSAGSTPAGITLSSNVPGGKALVDNEVEDGNVTAPSLSTDIQSEQTISTQSKTIVSGAKYLVSGTETTSGANSANTGASTDPESGTSSLPLALGVSQTGTTLVKNGIANDFTFGLGSGDSGAAASTTSSTSSTQCNNLLGVPVASAQACSSGQLTPSGTLSASLRVSNKTIELASIAASTTPARTFVARYTAAASPYCAGSPAPSGVGCISANAQRSFGTAKVGTIPAGTSGADGFSMATVTGYTDAVRAESGVGAGTSAATRTGTLTYWAVGGVSTSVNLATLTTAQSLVLAPVGYSYNTGPLGTVQVLMNGTITIAAPSTTPSGAAPCAAACGMTSTGGSVVASVTYDISAGGVNIGHFTVSADLGSALAKTSYRAAPSA